MPNCRTHEGVFGGRKNYESPQLSGKYSLWCAQNDYICGSSRNPFRNSGHTAYASSGGIDWGLMYLANKYGVKKTGQTERPVIDGVLMRSSKSAQFDLNEFVDDGGSANIQKPDSVNVWRDGDSLRMRKIF